MKRCLVLVKLLITRIAVLYANLRNVVWQWLNYGLCKLSVCCGSSFDTMYHHKTRFAMCQKLIINKYRLTHIFIKCKPVSIPVGKRNVSVYILDTVLVHQILCEYVYET